MTRVVKYLKGGVITIPKAIRDELGWGPGTELVVEAHADQTIVLRKPDPVGGAKAPVRRRPRQSR